jgi:hypothetical protein
MTRHASPNALVLLICTIAIGANPGDEPAPADSPPDPALVAEVSRLVEASLEALRDRKDHRYQAFLEESLSKLPDFAPARWHSGYVQLGGAWVHVDEVPYRAGDSAALRKYAELREQADERHFPKETSRETSRTRLVNSKRNVERLNKAHPSEIAMLTGRPFRADRSNPLRRGTLREQLDTYERERIRLINTAGYSEEFARAQESLASWCAQHGLTEEAQVHWACVLKEEPANQRAAQALGLTPVDGRLLTKDQVARARRLESDAARSIEKWQEQLVTLEREAASSDSVRRKAAVKELQAIDDPNAVFALEHVMLWQSPAKGPRASALEAFHRAVVALIGKFGTQPATESLVRLAVLHEHEPVRTAAAEALKSREPREFAPLLLAGLTMPIEYRLTQSYDEDGRQQVQAVAEQEHENHIARVRDSREIYNGWHLQLLTTAAMARRSEVRRFNLQTDQVNRRIVTALLGSLHIDPDGQFGDLTVSPETVSPDPKRWWDWWYDYNEQYVSGEKPYQGYDYGWNAYDDYQASFTPMSCFAKGTPVWTLSGQKPIEQIKVGDRVLAQHPETGELTYKGVLVTTLRPPSAMLTIRAGKSAITTTLGHPFFVVGKGWRMAKELTEADWICARGQTLPIDAIEKAEPAEAHNLMVADFGTYFVGKDRILVHDNSPIPPTRLEMPGLLAVR